MPPFGEAATRALARRQAQNLVRFLLNERTHSAQLVALASNTVGKGPDVAREFLRDYVDEMAKELATGSLFDESDEGRRQLDAMLTSLAHGLSGALRGQPWAASAIDEAIETARGRHVHGAPVMHVMRGAKVA